MVCDGAPARKIDERAARGKIIRSALDLNLKKAIVTGYAPAFIRLRPADIELQKLRCTVRVHASRSMGMATMSAGTRTVARPKRRSDAAMARRWPPRALAIGDESVAVRWGERSALPISRGVENPLFGDRDHHENIAFESHFGARRSPARRRGQLEEVVEHWSRATGAAPSPTADDRPATSCRSVPTRPVARAAQLAEIVALVESQGEPRRRTGDLPLAEPNPRTLLGKGTAQDIAARARARGATMLVLDAELSPSQTRNLEDRAGIPICDREAVILNVFLRHARTRRARSRSRSPSSNTSGRASAASGSTWISRRAATSTRAAPAKPPPSSWRVSSTAGSKQLQKALRKLETSSQNATPSSAAPASASCSSATPTPARPR